MRSSSSRSSTLAGRPGHNCCTYMCVCVLAYHVLADGVSTVAMVIVLCMEYVHPVGCLFDCVHGVCSSSWLFIRFGFLAGKVNCPFRS